MDKELKEKLHKIAPHLLEEKDLPLFLELQKINENLEKIAEKEMPHMEMPETHKVELPGVELITIQGKPGPKGDTPTDEHLVELITPLIPEPIIGPRGPEGKKGESIIGPMGPEGKDGESIIGPAGENGKDGSPDTPEQIREKLESLKEENRLDASAIKGLDDKFKEVETKISSIPRGGGGTSALGVAQAFKYIAHTKEPVGAIDGVNLTYVVPGVSTIWWIAGFTLNGEQIAELPNFTYAGNTITFASAIPASYSGKDFEVKLIGT